MCVCVERGGDASVQVACLIFNILPLYLQVANLGTSSTITTCEWIVLSVFITWRDLKCIAV